MEVKELEGIIAQQIEGVKAHFTKLHGDFTTEHKSALDEVIADGKKWVADLAALGVKLDQIVVTADAQAKLIDSVEKRLGAPSGTRQDQDLKMAGSWLTGSEEWKAWQKRGWHKGGMSLHFGEKSELQGLKGASLFLNHYLERKTTIDSTAIGSSTPGILVPQRLPGVAFEGVRRLRVRDLLRRIRTTNNAVEWVKTNTITNNASPQTEAADKAESAMTFVIDSSPVRTLAHWIPATRQVLDDTDFLADAINFELLKGLADVEDYELLQGSGSGQHISGLITEASTYSTTFNVAGDTKLDTLNHALLQLEESERQATGIVLHPRDWRAITLIKEETGGANTGAYLLGGPGAPMFASIWDVPKIVTTAMPIGKFLVGDFEGGAVLADRMDARIDVSTEHSDFFIKNMVAIRAEERLALIVRRDDYFVYGSFPS